MQRVVTMGAIAIPALKRRWGDPTYDASNPDDDPNDPTTWTGPDDGSGGSSYSATATSASATATSAAPASGGLSSYLPSLSLGVPVMTGMQVTAWAAGFLVLGYALVKFRHNLR